MWPGLCLSAGRCPHSGCLTAGPALTACASPPGCPQQSSWPALWATPRHPPPVGSGSHLSRSEVDTCITQQGRRQKDGTQIRHLAAGMCGVYRWSDDVVITCECAMAWTPLIPTCIAFCEAELDSFTFGSLYFSRKWLLTVALSAFF